MDQQPFSILEGNTIWILAGLSVLLTSLIAAARALQRGARQRRILRARPASIGDARDGELVIVRGKVRGAQIVRAPVTGKHALWTRLIVRGEVARPGMLTYTTLLREIQARAFVIEDPSGQLEVAPDNAHVVVGPDRIDRSYTPEGGAFDARLLPVFREHIEFGVLSDDKALVAVRTVEEALLPGDEVSVIGIAQRQSPTALRIGPSQDGLFVVQGDVNELAKSGALWKDSPDA